MKNLLHIVRTREILGTEGVRNFFHFVSKMKNLLHIVRTREILGNEGIRNFSDFVIINENYTAYHIYTGNPRH